MSRWEQHASSNWDAEEIISQSPEIVEVDSPEGFLRKIDCSYYIFQAALHKNNVSCLNCYICACTNCNSYISSYKRWFGFCNNIFSVNSNLLGYGICCSPVVTCYYHTLNVH